MRPRGEQRIEPLVCTAQEKSVVFLKNGNDECVCVGVGENGCSYCGCG